jgi:aryl-alcohol dehydrogenase-like predicted oxidoreductase
MQYRPLGRTGWRVSAMGLGTYPLGGAVTTTGGSWTGPVTYGAVAAEEAVAAIHGGLARGLTFIDTAPVYGEAEVFVARALRTWAGPPAGDAGGRCYVGTKCGEQVRRNAGTGGLDLARDFSRGAVRQSLAASRQRLAVDRLDLVLLHSPSPEELAEDPLGLLVELRERGEVTHIGVSARDLPEAVDLIERDGRAEVVQIGFNLLQPSAVQRLLPLAADRGVGIVVRTPLASGFLTGALREDHAFAPDDYRSTMRRERIAQLVRQADAFAWLVEEGVARSLPEAALRYVLSFDGVSTVIAGAMRRGEVVANLTAAEAGPLPAAALERIAAAQRELGLLRSPTAAPR